MTRINLADYNMIAVSAQSAQTDINTPQDLDTLLLLPKTALFALDKTIDSNKDKATGYEETTERYDKGARSSITFNFDQARIKDLGFLLTYHFGKDTPAAWGTGYKHVIAPDKTKFEAPVFPCFTAAQQIGNAISKKRYSDLFVDTLKTTWKKDSFLAVEGGIKGSGMEDVNVISEPEVIAGFYDDTTLTLAANGVQGATAAARLDSIHQVLVQVPVTLEWKPVVCTAASAATPSILTITAPGGVHTATNFKVLYVPTEPAWATFPAIVAAPPVLVGNMILNIGGKWDGTNIVGGDTIDKQFSQVVHSSQNGMILEPRPSNGANPLIANYACRGQRTQTLEIDKDMRDFILQQKFRSMDEFVVYLKATGPEFETGKNYFVEACFPKVGISKIPEKVNGKVIGETVTMEIMEDPTYGSVQYTVADLVAQYAG
jgi:hypothetical protein